MDIKLVIILILIAAVGFFLSQFPQSIPQFTPELKQERLKATVIPPSPLEYPNLRWNHMPLSVFLDQKAAGKSSYMTDVRLALGMWKDATSNLVSFELTDNRDADITITWVDKLRAESLDAAGDTDTKFYNQTNFKIITKADIQLLNKMNSKELTDFDMTNLAMHEIGHAVGLSHNNVEDSIMNPVLKIPSKEIKTITKPEIELLLDTYKLKAKPDLYISPNSTVTKIVNKRLFKEDYYLNTRIVIENIGLVDSPNATMQIKADNEIVREERLQSLPVSTILTRTYINLPVKGNFSSVEIIMDPNNEIDELNNDNNILVLKV